MGIFSRPYLYEMAERKGWILPKLNTPFCSLEYLAGVTHEKRKYWCPHQTEYIKRNCARPPLKEDVLKEVLSILEEKNEKLGDLSKGPPNIEWLLECLACLKPNHRFFKPDYVPPAIKKKKKEEPKLTGFESLLEGTPPPTLKQMRKRSSRTMNKLIRLTQPENHPDSNEEHEVEQ